MAESKVDSSVEDLGLIKKFKSGDESAFDQLVLKYQKKIYWLAYRMTGSHDDADDLAQETFVKAYMALGGFKEQYRFYTWLYRIALNLIINHQKRHKRQLSLTEASEGEAGGMHAVSNDQDPAMVYAQTELLEKIDVAVSKLPVRHKKVFCLRYYEEMSYQEIADALQISIGTVMSRLSRAREKLKKMIESKTM